jgi:uncharacterized protein
VSAKNELHIAKDLSLPLDAVTQTFGILGKRGGGKSYTAKVLAEEMLRAKAHIACVDPIGNWWGLRVGADGKSAGLPITVMGGEYGDIPIEPTEKAGELVARLIIEEKISVVVDLSLFRKGEQTVFMIGWAETLYRLNREALHVFVDEADAFAPQRPVGNLAPRLLGAMEDLVRRGRARGLGITMITQRSASINKDLLTQIEVLIAKRTIAPQDREAIEAWVEVHGTPEQQKTMMQSLPSLPKEAAWIWSPGWLDLFKLVSIRKLHTMDSSATPEVGRRSIEPRRLAEVDLEKVRERMAATIERAKADDPKELRRRIADLEKAAKAKPAPPAKVDPVSAKASQREAIEKATVRGATQMAQQVAREFKAIIAPMRKSMLQAVVTLRTVAAELEKAVPAENVQFKTTVNLPAEPDPPAARPAAPRPSPRPAPAMANGPGDGSVSASMRKILIALAQYPDGMGRDRLAALSGYTVNGHFNNMVGTLRTHEYITPALVSPIQILPAGLQALGSYEPLPVGEALRELWLNRVGASKGRILRVLFETFPSTLSRDELAARAGYTVNGHFNNMVGSLRTMGLITPPLQPIKAMEYLFDE